MENKQKVSMISMCPFELARKEDGGGKTAIYGLT